MDRSILAVCIATLSVLLFNGQAYATEPPWQFVKTMPFVVRNGLEIAHQAQGMAPASLYLVCSQNNQLHLILSTRLPGPRWTIEKVRDDNVSLFVGDIYHEFKLVMDLVEKGRDLTWLEAAMSRDADGTRDILVTTPINAREISVIGGWFGDTPPTKVSIGGYDETGVFMAGSIAGPAITEFSVSCVIK